MSASKLEQVLYDYHIAEAMSAESGIDSIKAREYLLAVFKKHGITEAEFDSTMVYYLRHAYELNNIYEHLSERINNEAQLQGIEGTGFVSNDANADTANIWNLNRSHIFFTQVPYNLMKFSFKADSTFKAGDHFTLKFKSNFLYQDGSRNGYAVLAMKLDNDSVITRTTSITSSMTQSIDVTDNEFVGVKEVNGFIMLRYGNYETERNSSTLRMMYVYDINLVKMHNNKPKDNNTQNEKTDSISPLRTDTTSVPQRGLHQLHSR